MVGSLGVALGVNGWCCAERCEGWEEPRRVGMESRAMVVLVCEGWEEPRRAGMESRAMVVLVCEMLGGATESRDGVARYGCTRVRGLG